MNFVSVSKSQLLLCLNYPLFTGRSLIFNSDQNVRFYPWSLHFESDLRTLGVIEQVRNMALSNKVGSLLVVGL